MKDRKTKIDRNNVEKVIRKVDMTDLFSEGESLENLIESMKDILEKYGKDATIENNYSSYCDEGGISLVYKDDENNAERLERLEKKERERVWRKVAKEEEYKQYLKLHAKFSK